MKAGQLSQSIYECSVRKEFQREQVSIYKGAEDNCAFLAGLFQTETFALCHESVAAMALYMAANALTAKGGKPVGASLSLILTTRQSESFLKKVIREAAAVFREYGMCLLTCQAEVIEAVTAPMAVVTVMGEEHKPQMLSGFVRAGQDVVMSKSLALGATAVLADVKEEDILARYSRHLLEQTRSVKKQLNVTTEAALAEKSGVSAMCHVNKGGVFGALWEMADRAGIGLDIDLKAIPVKQETIEISEIYDVNPYEMLGTGSLLMIADDGHELARTLQAQGIMAAVIGKTTDGNDRVIRNEGESRFLEPVKPDELLKVL